MRAFRAAFADMPAPYGLVLVVPPGTYRLHDDLRVNRRCTIMGTGGGAHGSASKLVFDAGEGIVLESAATAPTDDVRPGGDAGGARLVGLEILAAARGGPTHHGIVVLAPSVSLEHLYIHDFGGNGIHIVGRAPDTGASLWQIQHSTSLRNGGHGCLVDGPDANAGVATRLSCTGNDGYGVYDSSFLGNTWIASHTDNNKQGAYCAEHPTARSLFLGGYAELGQPHSEIRYSSTLVGRLHGPPFSVNTDGMIINESGQFRQRRRWTLGPPAALDTGTWNTGDRVWNNLPLRQGTMSASGWICVRPGTQGTYRELDGKGQPTLPPLTATTFGTTTVELSGRTRVLNVGMYLDITTPYGGSRAGPTTTPGSEWRRPSRCPAPAPPSPFTTRRSAPSTASTGPRSDPPASALTTSAA